MKINYELLNRMRDKLMEFNSELKEVFDYPCLVAADVDYVSRMKCPLFGDMSKKARNEFKSYVFILDKVDGLITSIDSFLHNSIGEEPEEY